MNKKIKNRIVFYTMLLVLFVIVNVVVSFAYLRGRANNNESVSTIAIEGVGEINVTYSSDTPDIVVGDILPGYETVKNFTVTSNISSGGVVYNRGIWYQIKLIVDTNEFMSESLVYSLSLDDNSSTDGITALPLNKIAIPNGANSDGILVGTGYFSSDNVSHIYNLKINYVNLEDVDQSNDYQKKFAAHVVIDNPDYVNLTFNLDGGSFENLNLNRNSTMKVAANSTIDFPIPIKNGLAFTGWEIVSGNVSANNNVITTGSDDVTLKALWARTAPYDYNYTGGEQEFIAKLSGYYKIETWGAQGGGANGGKGGYSSGIIQIGEGEKIKVFVGGAGNSTGVGGYNGGGNAGALVTNNDGGGGATDIRINNNNINDRILVAGGGGGANANGSNTSGIGKTGGAGGGLNGYSGTSVIDNMFGGGATQVSGGIRGDTSRNPGTNGSFYYGGVGGTSNSTPTVSGGAGGGGGFYGGGSGEGCNKNCGGSGGGGSSYISGHTGCVAIVSGSSTSARTGTDGASCTTGTSDNLCSVHYSGKVFTDTVMIDGAGYSWTNTKGALQQMPNPSGGYYDSGVGHSGNGFARITFLHS